MKKLFFVPALCLIMSSCLAILPFYKYEEDPAPVNVHWKIESGTDSPWRIYESHDWAEGDAGVAFDGSYFNLESYNSNGRTPVFGFSTALESQSPQQFSNMFRYLDFFLEDITLGGAGTSNPEDIESLTYTSQTGVPGYSIPYEANITGNIFADFLDPTKLDIPGTLVVVEMTAESWNPFMKGSGIAVFHNGQPGGLIYFAFEHSSGYISIFSLSSYTSSQSGAYFGQLEGDYSWYFFPN